MRVILYTHQQRQAMDSDLRRVQDAFDGAVMSGVLKALGIRVPAAQPSGHRRPVVAMVLDQVRSVFERHPNDLGLAFADLADFAGRFGLSTEVLDEDAPPWTEGGSFGGVR